jgi:hypothetical protein
MNYIQAHIIAELPKEIECKEVSDGCYCFKNARNNRCLTYFPKINKIFINFNGSWKNNVFPIYARNIIIHSICL